MPIQPAEHADDQSGGGQSPGCNHSRAPIKLVRPFLRTKFLQETHLNAAGSLNMLSGIRENGEFRTQRIPRIRKRRALRATCCVLGGRSSLRGSGVIRAGVKTKQFKFFAVHDAKSS
jgi:hypothetical protein